MQDEPERRGLFPIQDEASAVVSGILISDEVNLDRSRRLPRPLLWQGGRSPPSAKADKDALLFGASYMRRARILLGEVSEEWKRIFVAIADANRDLEICGYVDKPVDLLLEMNALKPDAVVISVLANGDEPGICSHLLLEYPNICVLMLPVHPGVGRLEWMMLRKETMHYQSTVSLRTALRSCLQFRAAPGFN
jgi:hypothetical protein